MTRLLRMFIMSMLILYFGLLTAPAWSADAPRDETVILAFSSDIQTLDPHDHPASGRHHHVSAARGLAMTPENGAECSGRKHRLAL
jgi:hypothetical protein